MSILGVPYFRKPPRLLLAEAKKKARNKRQKCVGFLCAGLQSDCTAHVLGDRKDVASLKSEETALRCQGCFEEALLRELYTLLPTLNPNLAKEP